MNKVSKKIICQNKKAHHEYFIMDTYECGIALMGTEIKSIRLGKVSINDAYCQIKKGEMIIENMHISKYEQGNIFNHDPLRPRKLLLHKREINKINNSSINAGYTIIPLQVYLEKGLCKIEIALCKGKKLFDKRESLKEKTTDLEQKKELKNY